MGTQKKINIENRERERLLRDHEVRRRLSNSLSKGLLQASNNDLDTTWIHKSLQTYTIQPLTLKQIDQLNSRFSLPAPQLMWGGRTHGVPGTQAPTPLQIIVLILRINFEKFYRIDPSSPIGVIPRESFDYQKKKSPIGVVF